MNCLCRSLALVIIASQAFARDSRERENELIKLISRSLNIKNILFLAEDGIRGNGNDLDDFKHFGQMMMIFTSVWTVENLQENASRMRGSRALVVLSETENHLQYFRSLSNIHLSHYTWLFISPSPGVNLTHFADVFIPFDVQFLYASLEGDQITINEIYQTTNNSKKSVYYYGDWSPSRGLVAEERDIFSRRTNFEGDSFRYMLYSINPGKLSISELEVSPPINDEVFGVYVQKMLERIKIGRVHSSVIPLLMTSARVAHSKFLWPIRSTSYFVFTKVPDAEINFSSYLQPFNRNLWIATVAWLLSLTATAVSFKFFITSALMKKSFCFLMDAGDDLLAPFSALCSQDINGEMYDKLMSLRMLVIISHMVPLFLLPSYSGALISFLGNPPPRLPFTDLKEFEDNGKYKLTAISASFDETFLTSGEKFSGAREKNLILEMSEFPRGDEQGFEMICRRKVSYFVGELVLMRDQPECEVFSMDEYFGTLVNAMAVSLDFPLKEQFNRVLVKRFTCGLKSKHLENIVMNSLKIDMIRMSKTASKHFSRSANFDSVKPFTLEDVLPIFAVFSFGLALTVATFLCEKCRSWSSPIRISN
ncbi:UNVERIFIED_CONTAM: hypothetical protein PYX00_004103 [Menopon gallinae]|uniref:Ionotropic receptor n=1 Tax=Menopon gallinae TaxID=328185 RepID=A0AAW2I3U2_9NEOP